MKTYKDGTGMDRMLFSCDHKIGHEPCPICFPHIKADEVKLGRALYQLNYRVQHGQEFPDALHRTCAIYSVSQALLTSAYDGQQTAPVLQPKLAEQDGPDFYDQRTDDAAPAGKVKPVASYRLMVLGDADLAGAIKAREQFLLDHPEYRMAP